MAKRQQQQDFLPTKAIQPQQQITDNFIATNPARVNQSELVEIGQALAGLSPTLKKFEERDRAQSAAQMQLKAEGMSLDQLRTAAKRDWNKLKADGIISEGSSPYDKVALLEAVGKQLARRTRTQLYGKLNELSDPDSALTIDDVLADIEKEHGMDSLYTQTSYRSSVEGIRNQFEGRVLEAKHAKIEKRNSETVVDEYVETLSTWNVDDDNTALTSVMAIADESKLNTGAPRHEELLTAVQSEYMRRIRLGDEKADDLLTAVENLKFGNAVFGTMYGAELSKLRDNGADAREIYLNREDKARRRKDDAISASVKAVIPTIALDVNEDPDFDPMSEEAEVRLRTILTPKFTSKDGTVDEESLNRAILEGREELKRMQPKAPDEYDPILTGELIKMSRDPDVSFEEVKLFYETHKENINPNAMVKVYEEDSQRMPIGRLSVTFERVVNLDSLSTEFEGLIDVLQVDDATLKENILAEYKNKVRSAIQEEIRTAGVEKAEDMDIEFMENLRSKVSALTLEYRNALSLQSDTSLDPNEPSRFTQDADGLLGRLQEKYRARESETRAAPSVLQPDTKLKTFDTQFTDEQFAFIEANPEEQKKLAPSFFALAQTVAFPNYYDDVNNLEDYELSDYIRANAIVGYTLEMIKNRELPGGVELPDTAFDPKHAVVLSGIDSLDEFEAEYEKFKQAKDNKQSHPWDEVYDALPVSYQYGTNEFLYMQKELIRKYR